MSLTDDAFEIAESKVLLLYFINKIKIPVSRTQVTRVILENKFMNYFFLHQYLNELYNDKLINIKKEDHLSFYTITEKGVETLNYLVTVIPAGLKIRIDNSIGEIRQNIRNQTYIDANYYPENENMYNVKCSIKEDDFVLFEYFIAAGSKETARKICNNFKKNSSEVYTEIIDVLLKER